MKRLFDFLISDKKKRKKVLKAARHVAGIERIGGPEKVLHSYPSYDAYRDVQIAGNKAKLERQFVQEPHIQFLAEWLNDNLGRAVDFGLCHGTRRGNEQAWFSSHLAGHPNVIGTDIAETCLAFANSVVWDFHEENPDWEGRADFVYSNSWDHAYDPEKAFGAWFKSLKPGGVIMLDFTVNHAPEKANELDPFGTTLAALQDTVAVASGGSLADQVVLDCSDHTGEHQTRVVVARKPDQRDNT